MIFDNDSLVVNVQYNYFRVRKERTENIGFKRFENKTEPFLFIGTVHLFSISTVSSLFMDISSKG